MPSSTSSSDRQAAATPVPPPARLTLGEGWGKSWRLALLIVAAVVVGAESVLRAAGFVPSVRDDPETWAAARARVAEDSVVILGTSRVQAAIDPTAWAQAWPGPPPVQLAIAGDTPLSILEDLAGDRSFRGVVVVEILPRIVFGAGEQRGRQAGRNLAAAARARSSPSLRAETRLRIALSERLVLRSLPTGRLLNRLLRPGGPRVPYFSMDGSRFLRLDFERADLERRRATLLEQIGAAWALGDSDRDAILQRLLAAEAVLRERAARLVWLHMPRRGAVSAIEEERFPRQRYWDVLSTRSSAPSVWVDSVPSLADFECPDGSHIDVRDAPPFSRALAEELRKRIQRS